MDNAKLSKLGLTILVLFFVFYLLWLHRAYYDVIWMDQVQWLAGNINNFYNHKGSIQDFYYLTPYMESFSVLWAFINCKLFSYNTYVDNVLSAIFLFFIARYFVKNNQSLFPGKARFYFIAIAALMTFGLNKWEASLNSIGLGFYIVIFAVFVCMNLAHRYYLSQLRNAFLRKHFISVYIILVLLMILEYGPYYVAFQISMFALMLICYKVFRDKIDPKKWNLFLIVNVALLITFFTINYLMNAYSSNHEYSGYPKVTMSETFQDFFNKLTRDPLFVIKFFLAANTGNFIGPEFQQFSSLVTVLPILGLMILFLYAYCIIAFIKRKEANFIYPVGLIFFVIIFYALVTVSRTRFNDVYYGTASRYSAATFSGGLGVATIFLSLLLYSDLTPAKSYLYRFTLAVLVLCYLVADRNQWKYAPNKKKNFLAMAEHLKSNLHLESLQGWSADLTSASRKVMIKNQLNVFKAETNLKGYKVGSDLKNMATSGFYALENSSAGQLRWTNGKGEVFLPNLYGDDSIKLKLFCHLPQPDTPMIVLNDNVRPSGFSKFDQGFEYTYKLRGQLVVYKATILNKRFIPHSLDKSNMDDRTLGLAFTSLIFDDP